MIINNPHQESENSKIYSKKGQISGTVGTVISLIVGIGVAVLVLIFVGVLGGKSYNIAEDRILEIGNQSTTADTFTANNITAVGLDHANIHQNTLHIYNTSAPNTEWSLNNFTIDYTQGTVLLTGGQEATAFAPMVNGSLSANYSWGNIDVQTHLRASITSGFEALEDTGDYLPLIVLGIIIFLVLSLILGMTAIAGGGGFRGSAL